MAWPTTPFAPGDLVSVANLNALPIRIADSTLGADSANINFSSIPSVYAHLWIVTITRNANVPPGVDWFKLRFNNDSAGNYDWQELRAVGSGATANEAYADVLGGACGISTNNGAPANMYSISHILIPHYGNSSNNKTWFASYACWYGTGATELWTGCLGGAWRSSAAINRITFITHSAVNIKTQSRITLYGLPG